MGTTTVRVGTSDYTLKPFKAFKAIIVGEILSDLGDEIRELMGRVRTFQKEYGQTHVVKFTAAQVSQRGWVFPEEAFIKPEGGEPYVELPAIPSQDEIVMYAFPTAFKLARAEVAKMLALIVIPDEELRVIEANGQMDDKLRELGDKMLIEGEIGEIVELLAATVTHAREQLEAHKDAVGKLQAAWKTIRTSAPQENDERNRTIVPMTVVSGGSDESPESSTSSPTPTGGTETESSTELTGASSST